MTTVTESTYRVVMGNIATPLNECHECDGIHLDDIILRELIPKL